MLPRDVFLEKVLHTVKLIRTLFPLDVCCFERFYTKEQINECIPIDWLDHTQHAPKVMILKHGKVTLQLSNTYCNEVVETILKRS